MKKDPLLEQLLASHRLVWYQYQIKHILEQEKRKRFHLYELNLPGNKVEFINGEVIVLSPENSQHRSANIHLLSLLDTFVVKHNLGYIPSGNNLISLSRNDYQPDICFYDRSKSASFTSNQTQFPAPDFIVEILSLETEERDRGIKFADYADSYISEYWIIDVQQQIVEQYILDDEEYYLKIKSNSGELQSAVVSNFAIPIPAIFDEEENMRVLEKILL